METLEMILDFIVSVILVALSVAMVYAGVMMYTGKLVVQQTSSVTDVTISVKNGITKTVETHKELVRVNDDGTTETIIRF